MKRDTQIKLAKLVGMLGSDHDNEILTAVNKMKDLLKAEKLSIPDLQKLVLEGKVIVTKAAEKPKEPPPWDGPDQKAKTQHTNGEQSQEFPGSGIAWMADQIMKKSATRLRPHEKKFVEQMGTNAKLWPRFEMTEKQASWFAHLFNKYS